MTRSGVTLFTRILLPGLLAGFCSGCGTFANNDENADHKPYGGVVGIYRGATGKAEGHGANFLAPLLFLDMPFSLVGDTLMLPFDVYYQHQVRSYQESLRRSPPDPDPLAGWQQVYGVQPDPAIVTDYENYIEQLPQDQRKVLIVNDSRLFEDGKGAHAMVIRLWLRHRECKHVLIYDDSNRRVQVMKYANGHAVP